MELILIVNLYFHLHLNKDLFLYSFIRNKEWNKIIIKILEPLKLTKIKKIL